MYLKIIELGLFEKFKEGTPVDGLGHYEIGTLIGEFVVVYSCEEGVVPEILSSLLQRIHT